MSDIATELISAYHAKAEMSAAFLEKGVDDIPSCISSYGDAIRSLGDSDVTMPDIEGNLKYSVTIPYGTTEIGPYAFAYNPNLTTVKIPKTVVKCDPTAFYESQNVRLEAPIIFKDMTDLSGIVTKYITSSDEDGTYTSSDNTGTIWYYRIENEMAVITGMGGTYPDDIVVPAFFNDTPVRKIRSYGTTTGGAFYNKTMKSIQLPYTLTGITNTYNFLSCKNLSSIDIPDTVTELGAYSFQYCTGLTYAHIPGSLSSIPGNTFNRCTNLSTVQIDEGIVQLGTNAFIYSGLLSIELPKSYIGQGGLGRCIAECKQLTSFSAPECEVISSTQFFRGDSNLTILDIPKVKCLGRIVGTTSAQTQEDMQLSSLTTLELPSIETILTQTFGYSATQFYTPNLKDLYIPNKPFKEIITMENYDTWYLPADCRIHALDRTFYYSLPLNDYTYTI